ncbi:MAG TPA: hypothetical protein VFN23_03825 [Ktedonobacteraceae bacterium]|nr:hypothetical protein [Ktedonobacteraceae bacterium]
MNTTVIEVCLVLIEQLSLDEEADFLRAVNDAAAKGELTSEEACQLIDREYELLAQAEKGQ